MRVEPAGDWLRGRASQSHLAAVGDFQRLTLSDPGETTLNTETPINQSINQSISGGQYYPEGEQGHAIMQSEGHLDCFTKEFSQVAPKSSTGS